MKYKTSKILTHAQAKELEWFCKNVVGTRQEYYKLLDQMKILKNRLNRLMETNKILSDYFGKETRAYKKINWNKDAKDETNNG